MKLTVTKIIALFLIVSVVVELSSAAPMTKKSSTPDNKPRNPKNPHRRRLGQNHLKNGDQQISREHRKLFKGITPDIWKNACNHHDASANSNDNLTAVVPQYQRQIDTQLSLTKTSLKNLQFINVSQLESWEEFYNASFEFLPTKPKGLALEWHRHTQIFVATFAVLRNISRRYEDRDEESQKISQELEKIFHDAQALLCEIEIFVNGTMQKGTYTVGNERRKSPIDWYTKQEIMRIVNITDPEDTADGVKEKISYVFVAGRFQQYLNKLTARVAHFDLQKNMANMPKFLKSHINRRNRRKGNNRRKNNRNFQIVTTSKTGDQQIVPLNSRKNQRTSKAPTGLRKRNNRINTSLRP